MMFFSCGVGNRGGFGGCALMGCSVGTPWSDREVVELMEVCGGDM